MGQEVAEQTTGAIVMKEGVSYGAENIESQDLLIPKLMLVQKMSRVMDKGVAVEGDIVDSLDNTKYGDFKTPLEFIALDTFKTWYIFEGVGPARQFKEAVKYSPENATWKYEDTIDGHPITRQLVANWYVLLPSQIKSGDAFPYCISFKGTNMQAARSLATLITKLTLFKKPAFAKTFKLSPYKDSNDKGSWAVYNVQSGRDCTEAEIQTAFEMYTMLKTTRHKVDEAEVMTQGSLEGEEVPF